MIRWLFILVSILFAFNLVSQTCEIEVHVSYVGGEPCKFCTVQLTKLDSITVLDFKYTDSLGYLKFKTGTYEDEILLRATQFGYRDSIIAVFCNMQDQTEINLVLHPLSLELDEVTIIDKMALLKKTGDTTTFNLEAIESGFEISTFDIVQRFPGIEISGNKISYHGKPLNEILIGDIDISDQDQVQLLKSIRYDLINQIQILENQNIENNIKIDSASLGSVMRVDIKEKAKGSMLYGFEGGLGYKNVYSAKVIGVYVGQKNGLRIEGIANNSYDNMLSQEKDQILNQIIQRELFNHRYKSTFENSETRTSSKGNGSNRTENQSKIIYSKNIKYGKIKTINSLTRLNNESLNKINENFFRDTIEFNTSQNRYINILNFNSSTSINYFNKSTFSLSFNLPINISIHQSENNINTISRVDTLLSFEDKRKINMAFIPNYRLEYGKLNTAIRLIGRISYKNIVSNRKYSVKDSLFSQFLEDEDNMRFGQELLEGGICIENQLRITHHHKKIKLVYNTILVNQNENISVTTSNFKNDSFIGAFQLKRITNDNSLFIKFEGTRFKFQGGLKQFYHNQSSSKEDNKNIGIYPYMFSLFEINNKWNLSASFNFSTTLPTIFQLSRINIFTDMQRAQMSRLAITSRSDRRTFSISLFKDYETGENSKQFNFNANYTLPYNEILQQADPTNIILKTSWQLGLIKEEATFNLYYAKYGRYLNYSFRFNSAYRLIQAENLIYEQVMNSITCSIKHRIKRLSYYLQLTIRKINNLEFSSLNFTNLYLLGNVRHEYNRFSQLFRFNVIGSLKEGQIALRPILSLRFNYKIPVNNIEFSLDFANINNLDKNVIVSYESSLQSTIFNGNIIQSGNIMIFLRKLF